MKIKNLVLCRGDGKGYARLRIVGSAGRDVAVEVALEDGSSIPTLWLKESDPASDVVGVLVFPLLDDVTLFVRVVQRGGDEPLCAMRLPAGKLKWLSRLNYRLRPSLCVALRGADERSVDRLRLSLVMCMPDGEEGVWRIAAESRSLGSQPRFSAWDGVGHALQIDPIFFEDQCIPDGTVEGVRRRMVVSVRVPAATGGLFVVAEDETGAALPAMLGFDKAAFFGELHRALRRVRNAADEDDYRAWRESRKMEGLSGSRLDPEVSLSPLVSIVVPCYRVNERYFEEMLESVLAQSYVRWELVLVDSECESSKVPGIVERIADDRITVVPLRDNLGIVGNTNAGIQHARGEYVAFLDYDDVLEPNALEAYVQAIAEHPDAGLLYCDEDSFEVGGAFRNPVFKTDFNRDLLYSHNCITHWLMVRKDVLAETGLSDDEVNGAQDYDLALRVSETGREIVHVPHMLYHWRVHGESTAGANLGSKPYAHQAGKIALRRHFDRRGIPVSVEDGDGPFVYRVRYQLPDPQPSVEILIPSKDHVDVLDRCVRSILEKSAYGNYRITVIENNSMEDETFAYYRELEARSDRVRVIEWPHGFNYAKIMNFGAASTDADLLLLLNNDTEVIAPDFIEEMAGYLQRPEVGVVGAKLLYYDGLVQHAGMLIGPDGTVVHVNQNVPDAQGCYLGRSVRPGNFSSVTGACQMVKRTVFEEVGGYSEEFAVGYNDADFCCKVSAAGYSVTFTPYAKLYHNEFVSRGREEGDPSKMQRWLRERALMQEKWPQFFEQGDPFSNPNLDRDSLYFALPSPEDARR